MSNLTFPTPSSSMVDRGVFSRFRRTHGQTRSAPARRACMLAAVSPVVGCTLVPVKQEGRRRGREEEEKEEEEEEKEE